MKLQYVPLLGIQQTLYNIPPAQRFDAYLDTMMETNPSDGTRGNELEYPPLVNMNPMANNERLLPILRHYEEDMNVDSMAKEVVTRLATIYEDLKPSAGSISSPFTSDYEDLWKIGCVAVDDSGGSWTNKVDVEYENLFDNQRKMYKRGWLDVILWTSDYTDSEEVDSIIQNIESCIHRFVYQQQQRDGSINDDLCLADMLDQEAWVWDQVRITSKKSNHVDEDDDDDEDIQRVIQILRENGQATDYPTLIAGLFGDDAAIESGHPSLNLGTSSRRLNSGLDLCKYGLWKRGSTDGGGGSSQ